MVACGKELHEAASGTWGGCKTGSEHSFEIRHYIPCLRGFGGSGEPVCGNTEYVWMKKYWTLLCSECAKLNGFIW